MLSAIDLHEGDVQYSTTPDRRANNATASTCTTCTVSPTECAPGHLWPLYTGNCVACNRPTRTSAACGQPHCVDCRRPQLTPDSETENQVWARTYSNAGHKIFPLWPIADGQCTCRLGTACESPGKHPLYAPAHPKGDPLHSVCKYGGCGKVGHGLYDATDDPDINAERWARRPDAGIGMPAQGNGFVIIDVDPRNGGDPSFMELNAQCLARGVDLTMTLAQFSGEYEGSRGVHYLFRAPDGGIKGKSKAFGPDLLGLDLRGRGHYIVVAPTLHISGVRYEWVDWLADAALWPDMLTAIVDPPKAPPMPIAFAVDRTRSRGYAALDREITAVRSTGEGNRNNRLNEAAYYLGQLVAGGELDRETVRQELQSAGESIGLNSAAVANTIKSGFAAGDAKPRTRPVSNA